MSRHSHADWDDGDDGDGDVSTGTTEYSELPATAVAAECYVDQDPQ